MPTLQLSRRVTTTPDTRQRLQAWISFATPDLDEGVFVYQRLPKVPRLESSSGLFVHVASYADQQSFPAEAPGDTSPFYRLRYIDLLFDSLAILEEKWRMLKGHVQLLVTDVVQIKQLTPTQIEEIEVP